MLPDVRWFWYPVLTALSILIAVVGHDLLHLVQRWLTYVLIVAFAITTVIAFTLPAAPAVAATPGFDLTAFLVQFSLAAATTSATRSTSRTTPATCRPTPRRPS